MGITTASITRDLSISCTPGKNAVILLITLLLSSCTTNNQEMNIDSLRDYALNYPVTTKLDSLRFVLPTLPAKVEDVVQNRIIDDEYMLYVSLILARHYRSQITIAGQSYIINKNHPLWVVFEKYSGIKFQSEYELSNVIYYNWLSPNSGSLHPILKVEYEEIKKELVRVGNPA